MHLKIGLRLVSQVDETEAIVLEARTAEAALRCGGEVMMARDGTPTPKLPMHAPGSGNLVGKRYRLDDLGIELLITHAGTGILEVDGAPFIERPPARLPSSD